MIQFACPGCSTVFTVGDEKAGKLGKCPSCSAQFEIPEADPAHQYTSPPPPSGTNVDVEIKPCPGCQAKLTVSRSELGLDVECPYCKTVYKAARVGGTPVATGLDERPSRRRRDDDDDFEDDFEEVPRRRRRRSGGYRERAYEAVKAPAIALMIVGVLGFMYGLLNITVELMGMNPQQNPFAPANVNANANNQAAFVFGKWVGISVSILYGILVFIAGLQMKSLSNRAIVYVGVIFGLLPCNLCCLFGLPFGIWALVVLNTEDVQRSFHS